MLVWFRERAFTWSERLFMRKNAVEAAVSTKCGFVNGVSEL